MCSASGECSFMCQLILFPEDHLYNSKSKNMEKETLLQDKAGLDPGLETRPHSGRKHVKPYKP